jgi:hypothetical protein
MSNSCKDYSSGICCKDGTVCSTVSQQLCNKEINIMEKMTLGYDNKSQKVYYGIFDEETKKFKSDAIDITQEFVYVLTMGYIPKDTSRLVNMQDIPAFTILNAEYSIEGYTKAIDTLQRTLDKMREAKNEKTEENNNKENK